MCNLFLFFSYNCTYSLLNGHYSCLSQSKVLYCTKRPEIYTKKNEKVNFRIDIGSNTTNHINCCFMF